MCSWRALLVVAISWILAARCSAQADQEAQKNVLDTAAAAGLTDLVSWIDVADLDEKLREDGPHTLFAPTNAAFGRLPPALVWRLKTDDEFLRSVLEYHVAPGRWAVVDLAARGQTTSMQGEDIQVAVGRNRLGRSQLLILQKNANATVIGANMAASNGIVHAINRVLLPPSLQPEPSIEDLMLRAGNLNTFLGLVESADMMSTLREGGPLTLFAPTDDAFNSVDPSILRQLRREPRLLKAVILSHIVNKDLSSFDLRTKTVELNSLGELIVFRTVGSVVLVNTARLLQEDLIAQNGALHIISDLLLPSINALGSQGLPSKSNLLEELQMNGLTIFTDLVKKSGMALIFQNGDPLTSFAPSNKALSSLPRQEVRRLTEDLDHLRKVVSRHILAEVLPTGSFVPDSLKNNFAGEKIRINVYKRPRAGDVYTANGVQLTVLDERGSNGILHIIDGILPPANHTAIETLQSQLRFSTFLSGLQASDLIATLKSGEWSAGVRPHRYTQVRWVVCRRQTSSPHSSQVSGLQASDLIATLKSGGWSAGVRPHRHTQLRTGLGSDGHILVSAGGGKVTKVIETDIVVSNGVIHVVDTVL
ncbi:periostin [Hyalella azteca]|uniref:Periostin n=1 Tax=Hyalella azteca TaxID=294128 RepID=A0A979FX48_HYAAZ|nr:periostin [Hyalella azteca]